jgi:hypothetical protein
MGALLVAMPVLSFLVLGAHFMREGAVFLTLACAALALAVAWRRPWVTRLLQVALLLGTLEWLWTAYLLMQERIATGRPWSRMAVILAVVALVTAGSILALDALRTRRSGGPSPR